MIIAAPSINPSNPRLVDGNPGKVSQAGRSGYAGVVRQAWSGRLGQAGRSGRQGEGDNGKGYQVGPGVSGVT